MTNRMIFLAIDRPRELDLMQEVVWLSIYGERNWGHKPLAVQAEVDLPLDEVEIEVEEPARIIAGNAALQESLVAGDITALVASVDGMDLFKVPLAYWESRSPCIHTTMDLLTAEGSDNANIAGQPLLVDSAQIQKWQDVVQRAFDRSYGRAQSGMERKRPISAAAAERWYLARIENWKASKSPSRDDDVAAGREVGLTEDKVRKLRRIHAPAEWTRKGRRRGN